MKEKLIADLHIHSHFSMATSKDLTPENLDWWAERKGVNVVGTGDIAHPGWLAELKDKLEESGEGLYRLKSEYKIGSGNEVKRNPVQGSHEYARKKSRPRWSCYNERGNQDQGWSCYNGERNQDQGWSCYNEREESRAGSSGYNEKAVRFILTGEISSIYKHLGKTRKIHTVYILPDFAAAERFQKNLKKRGVNITSDGRPICGLSAHDLLETALESDERIYCIPAHIWTPWFSLFGAKSGYDRLEDCFGDLSDQISTLETGLSADVPMIRHVSALDKYSLISSSDAHSPGKLGRNATLIESDYSWDGIIEALRAGKTETIDTYPQAGKYHYDGHRKCGICWHPSETEKHAGICPICHKPVTVGVLNRVYQLSDRSSLPENYQQDWHYIMPLPQVISEITGVGEKSKTVQRRYEKVLYEGYSELELLLGINCGVIDKLSDPEVLDYIRKFNSEKLIIEPGYDGVYGKIRI